MPRLGTAANKVNYRGTYSGSDTYAVNDLVTYLGSTYIATVAGSGNLPTNTSYWAVFAAAGSGGGSGSLMGGYPLWFGSRWNFIPSNGGFGAYTPNNAAANGYLIRIPNACTITQLAIVCTTVATGGTATIGLYESNTDPRPTTLVPTSSTTFDIGTTGGAKTLTLSTPYVVTAPKHLWVLHAINGAATSIASFAGIAPFTTYVAGSTPVAASNSLRQFSGNPTVGTADITSSTTTQTAVTGAGMAVFFYCSSATLS